MNLRTRDRSLQARPQVGFSPTPHHEARIPGAVQGDFKVAGEVKAEGEGEDACGEPRRRRLRVSAAWAVICSDSVQR